MSFLDKFLDAVKVNDDYDDYDDDDFLDEADDDFDDEKPKKRFFKKLDDDFDDDLDDDLPPVKNSKKEKKERKEKKASSALKSPKQPKSQNSFSKVTPMYSVKKKSSGSSAGSTSEVCVIKPKQFDESTEIVDALLDNCTVILNLEGLDITLAQHIIDFTAGASYAIDGNIKKVSSYIFILTPEGVDITGDSQEILNDIAGSASMYEGF